MQEYFIGQSVGSSDDGLHILCQDGVTRKFRYGMSAFGMSEMLGRIDLFRYFAHNQELQIGCITSQQKEAFLNTVGKSRRMLSLDLIVWHSWFFRGMRLAWHYKWQVIGFKKWFLSFSFCADIYCPPFLMESVRMISKTYPITLRPNIDIDPIVTNPDLYVLMRRTEPYLCPSKPDVGWRKMSATEEEWPKEYIQIRAMKKSFFVPEILRITMEKIEKTRIRLQTVARVLLGENTVGFVEAYFLRRSLRE